MYGLQMLKTRNHCGSMLGKVALGVLSSHNICERTFASKRQKPCSRYQLMHVVHMLTRNSLWSITTRVACKLVVVVIYVKCYFWSLFPTRSVKDKGTMWKSLAWVDTQELKALVKITLDACRTDVGKKIIDFSELMDVLEEKLSNSWY